MDKATTTRLVNYFDIRTEMQMGDCLLWRSSTVLGWLIRKFSRADVNHAGLVCRFGEYEGLIGRRWTLEALENGIVLKLLSERLEQFKGKVWWLPLIATPETRVKIGEWALSVIGTPYDFGSLFKNAIARVNANARRLFCSEYCFMAWQAGGLLITGKAPRPGDIPALGIFKEPTLIWDR
jgi:hypothetical protein